MDKYLYLDKEKEKKKKASIMLFGAGTQTIAMLLMALDGKFYSVPDEFIFADTGDEPDRVYEYFEMFKKYINNKFGFKITTVRRNEKSLSQSILDFLDEKTTEKPKTLPYRTENGLMRYRQCTDHYKIRPIKKYVKEKYKPDKNNTIEYWFGISYDEMWRMNISQVSWIYNRYPLVENEIKRIDAINYVMNVHGLPEPPRSSCIECPFHNEFEWNEIKTKEPKNWDRVVKFDEKIRNFPGVNNKLYLNKNGKIAKPLKDFKYVKQATLFGANEECGGYCGV